MSRWILLLVVFLLMVPASCSRGGGGTSPEAAPAEVAIYDDSGCWTASVIALDRMFHWMGYRVAHLDAEQIRRGGLDACRLLCVPGGDMYTYAQSLSTSGIQAVRGFIENGGGYIGVCGGAYFAAERVIWQGNRLPMASLDLFAGSAEGPIDAIVPYPDSGMCRLAMVGLNHPILAGLPDSAWVLYYWGPRFRPDPGANVTVLARYSAVDEPAMLALDVGRGHVFLIGVHPEIEEDSDRDGGDVGQGFDDRGSEWDLMKAATQWCLREPRQRRAG
jgi:glutamine amidotransferase-like uncharacterized protein